MHENYSDYELRLAREIAEPLDDFDSMPYHLQNVRMFSESFLRKQLQTALSIPKQNIKKSRAALYTYLVTKNSKRGNDGHQYEHTPPRDGNNQ